MENYTPGFKYRLGLFVAGGLTLFFLAIFIIGKQKNMFNPVFKLTSTFSNVSGLQVGNNVRFSGINVGTVNNIVIINDTTVQIDMQIKKEVWQFIKSDCKVTLGSEGIIGDKLIIISQGSTEAPLAKDGQVLLSIEAVQTNTLMARLDVTTLNAEIISRQLSQITSDINRGNGTLTRLIQDSIMAENLNQTIMNLRIVSRGLTGTGEMMSSLKLTANNAQIISQQLSAIMNKINSGDGTLGRLIQDPTMAENLNITLLNLRKISNGMTGTDTLMNRLKITAANAEIISRQLSEMMVDINTGKGTLHRLIKDSVMAENLNLTLINLRKGSKGLDDNMTAAKHNIFFRGYFNKKAKKDAEKKEAAVKAAESKLNM